jgi:hypothetical protein
MLAERVAGQDLLEPGPLATTGTDNTVNLDG